MRRPTWTYSSRVYQAKTLWTIYRDDSLGVQLQVVTKRDWLFTRPKERCFFFIDGVERQYRSEDRMLRALNRSRFGDESPLHSRWSIDSLFADDRMWKASLSRS